MYILKTKSVSTFFYRHWSYKHVYLDNVHDQPPPPQQTCL